VREAKNLERITQTIGGVSREWLLFPAHAGAPLVVFLTGTGGTAEWADRETGWSELAAREGFTLAVPEALPPEPAKPPTFLSNPPRWNDGSPPLFANEPADDVSFLNTVITHAIAHTAIDPRRVFVTGFSNGAGMTFRFAAEAANRVTAIAPVAGYCWLTNPRPARPVPTRYIIGTRDMFVPLRGGDVRLPWVNRLVRRPSVAESLERWSTAIGCNVIPETQQETANVRIDRYAGPVPFDAVIVEGLGHHWPGGSSQLNPRMAGPASGAIHATTAIWDFFRQHIA
jgi:polyhydroxybutyrate depolymerase